MFNQVLCGGAPKRFAAAEIRDCLENAGLPGSVATVNQVELWPDFKLDVCQASEIAGCQVAKRQIAESPIAA